MKSNRKPCASRTPFLTKGIYISISVAAIALILPDFFYKFFPLNLSDNFVSFCALIYEALPKRENVFQCLVLFESLFTFSISFFAIGSLLNEKYLGLSFSKYLSLLKGQYFGLLEMVFSSALLLFLFLAAYFLGMTFSMLVLAVAAFLLLVTYAILGLRLISKNKSLFRSVSNKLIRRRLLFELESDDQSSVFSNVLADENVKAMIFSRLFEEGLNKTAESIFEPDDDHFKVAQNFLAYSLLMFIRDIKNSLIGSNRKGFSGDYRGYSHSQLFQKIYSNIQEYVESSVKSWDKNQNVDHDQAELIICLHSAANLYSTRIGTDDRQTEKIRSILQKLKNLKGSALHWYVLLVGIHSLSPYGNSGDLTWWLKSVWESETLGPRFFKADKPTGFVLSAKIWALKNTKILNKKQASALDYFLNNKANQPTCAGKSWNDCLASLLSGMKQGKQYFKMLKASMSLIEQSKPESFTGYTEEVHPYQIWDGGETLINETIACWVKTFRRSCGKGQESTLFEDYKNAKFSDKEKDKIHEAFELYRKSIRGLNFPDLLSNELGSRYKVDQKDRYELDEVQDLLLNGIKNKNKQS